MSLELRAGVGANRPNIRQDVGLVQFLLNGEGFALQVDGAVGDQTNGAIASYQTSKLGFTDGVVDPCDVTFKMMRGTRDNSVSAALRAVLLELLGELTFPPQPSEEVSSSDGQGLVTKWSDEDGITKIYSHPLWGTWEVRGLILGRYLELGDEAGPLGMPVTGERDHGSGGRISFFVNGRIAWDPASGVSEVIL